MEKEKRIKKTGKREKTKKGKEKKTKIERKETKKYISEILKCFYIFISLNNLAHPYNRNQ